MIDGDRGEFYAAVDAAAETMTAAIMQGVVAGLDQTLEAAGQTIDAAGRPLSWDLVLDAFESMEWTFDDQGRPEPKQIIAGPEAAAKFAALPPPTPEQEARYDEMMARKRSEDIARRGTRKLPR
jgi:hypothetical protein